MPDQNRPQGREKKVTSGGSGVHKRGSGTGTGPVGSGGAGQQLHSQLSGGGSGRRPSGTHRAVTRAGGISLPVIIIVIIVMLMRGGGGSSSGIGDLLGGLAGADYGTTYDTDYGTGTTGNTGGTFGGTTGNTNTGNTGTTTTTTTPSGDTSGAGGSLSGLGGLGSFANAFSALAGNSANSGYYGYGTGSSNTAANTSAWSGTSAAKLDTTVAAGSRAKYTEILGSGQDVMTILVYMCGTDLESRSSMATNDLQEMAAATIGQNVNIIVYTGGCKKWQNSIVSNSTNQIYQVQSGGLKRLITDDGAKPMTDPETLSSFIKWGKNNFPANRYALIFWDHGGGSVQGYGYDEKYASAGAMDLAEISQALKAGGIQYDFIGFDACLMATAETALMLDPYADYMIASEETEPGIGWYYTNWLTKLSQNTSMPTIEIGKNIVDDFTSACASSCRGQKTTLSVIDLAEFSNTVPEKLSAFSKSITSMIKAKEYQTVSDARYTTREFAQSSRIDQVDLVNLAENMGTTEGKELSSVLKGAVKYNKTSSNMTNAYGVSIYFPYQRAQYVDTMVRTYDKIGMDEDYAECIRAFAKLETTGQIAAGGSSSAMSSLFGGGSYSGGTELSGDMLSSLLGSFLGGGIPIEGLSDRNIDFMSDDTLTDEETIEILNAASFDGSALFWNEEADGTAKMTLSESQWSLVHDLEMAMFYDDGEGYVDLGLDTIYSFDENGALVADTDRTWISINGTPVAYYHIDTTNDNGTYTITGRVPVLLDGNRADLILVFDTENPYGVIAGATFDYVNGETETVAKNVTELVPGQTLDFLIDYYNYNGEYVDTLYQGDQMVVSENMTISNTDVGDGPVRIMYKFTDIYNQEYWSEALVR